MGFSLFQSHAINPTVTPVRLCRHQQWSKRLKYQNFILFQDATLLIKRIGYKRSEGTEQLHVWSVPRPEWSNNSSFTAIHNTYALTCWIASYLSSLFPKERSPPMTYFRAVAPKNENSTGAACLRSAGISASRIRWSSRCSLFFTRPTLSSPSDDKVT